MKCNRKKSPQTPFAYRGAIRFIPQNTYALIDEMLLYAFGEITKSNKQKRVQ